VSEISPQEAARFVALLDHSRQQEPVGCNVFAAIPKPETVAGHLPARLREGLATARQVMPDRIYRTTVDYAAGLRLWGLCEVNGYCLSAHGMKVRKVVVGDEK
jgi:hypothetical protein